MLAYENIKDIYTLSPLQKGMYFHFLYDPTSPAYFEQLGYRFTGDLNVDLMRKSMEELLHRHDILRTVFNHEKVDVPLQIVLKKANLVFHFEDIRTLGSDLEKQQHLDTFREADKKRAFDLTKDVLVRVALFQLGEDVFEFIWSSHHIIIDGWCTEILVGEFLEIYTSLLENRPYRLPKVVPYRQYIQWLETQDEKAVQQYWKAYLDGYDTPVSLPKLSASEPTDFQREVHAFLIPQAETAVLEQLAKDNQVTLNTVMQVLWGILLARYNQQRDVVFGMVVSGRPPEIEGVESMLGLFINTIPVRIQYNSHTCFDELVRQVHQQAIQSQSFAYGSLADIQEASVLKRNLINHLYGFQNYKKADPVEFAGEEIPASQSGHIRNAEPLASFEQVNYDFALRISPAEAMHGMFEYNAHAFGMETILRLEKDLRALVTQVATHSQILVDDLHLTVLDDTQKALLTAYNDTHTDYPRHKSIPDIFAEQVRLYPFHSAIMHQGKVCTYRELDQQSNQIAHFLWQHGLPKEGIVAIWQQQSIHLIASILGVLKAGGAYLPLHTQHPIEQVKNLLNDSGASILLSEAAFIRDLHTLQWECPALHTFVCLDAEHVHDITEPESRLMSRELWEYVGHAATDAITGGGWTNSYTGDAFSTQEMDEYAENTYQKLQPYLTPQTRVLEIGCASGISMFRMAPQVGLYYGTDLSQPIIDRNQQLCDEQQIPNIRLACLPAGEISQLDEQDFDVIILNSVVQCFSGLNYFRHVLTQALKLLKPQGIIFLGDLMDQELKDTMMQSLTAFHHQHPEARTKLDFAQELFLSRTYLEDLQAAFPAIETVHSSRKHYTIANELTDFRFDAILAINKTRTEATTQPRKHQYDASFLRTFSEEPVPISVTATQLSNIIYTSGSTGKPKGVMVEHRGLVRLVKNTNYMHVSPTDVWGQTVDIAFDPSTLETWAALLNGATLCLISKDMLLNVRTFAENLTLNRITMLVLITPIFHEIAATDPTVFAPLHTLIIGGEALNFRHVNTVRAACPNLRIINAYGPTENTVISTTFQPEQLLEEMYIGKPITNSEAWILDAQHNVLPFGGTGELCVAGDGLARGYLHDDTLTARKFIAHPLKPNARLYKTGDKARMLPDGTIQFLGRIDDQVKIRGYRIEPGEIEAILNTVAGVEEAVVLPIYTADDTFLCAFVQVQASLEETELRAAVATILPAYMVPARFVAVEKFPLTHTGKIDRKALLHSYQASRPTRSGERIEPRTEQEAGILAIWQEVLGTADIGVTDNFFERGGHSLKAMQVVSRLSKKFQVRIELKDFFASPTIEGIARLLTQETQPDYPEIMPLPLQEHYAISHAQKRLWILHQYEENQTAYNISGAYRFEGLNQKVFEQTLSAIVERHECLRTTFVTVNGEPRQQIHSAEILGVRMTYEDLRAQTNADQLAQERADSEAFYRFDLAKGPLVRMQLLQVSDNGCVFLFTMHHIISDGWSMRLLMQEVDAVYEAFSQGLPLPLLPLRVQYKDFVAWQQHMIRQKDEQYWLRKLAGHVNWIRLPHDFPETDFHAFRGGEERLTLPKEIKERLQEMSQEHHTSLSNVVFTIFNILLYNISGQEDLVVGVAIANRNHPDVEKMAGFFVNTLVLRTQIAEDTEFEALLKQVSKNMIEAFDHQNYPFDLLVERLNPNRITNKQPIFNVLYGFQNFADVVVDVSKNVDIQQNDSEETQDSIYIEAMHQDTYTSKFDLTLFVYLREDQLELSFEYNSELFKPEVIQKWLRYFEKFVGVLVSESASVV